MLDLRYSSPGVHHGLSQQWRTALISSLYLPNYAADLYCLSSSTASERKPGQAQGILHTQVYRCEQRLAHLNHRDLCKEVTTFLQNYFRILLFLVLPFPHLSVV